MLALLLLVLSALVPADTTLADSAAASPEAARSFYQAPLASLVPARDTVREPIQIRPRLAPSALYSNSRGVGIGAGIGVRNILFDGSDVTLDLRVSQRYQAIALSAFTADPFESAFFGTASFEASTTERQRYYGIGPYTTEENRLFLDYSSINAEGRIGAYPLGNTGLFLQPGVRFLLDKLREVDEDEDSQGALDRLERDDPRSFAAVQNVLDETRYGISLGLEVASDLRDWRSYPRKGTFVSLEGRRFYAMDGSGLRFNRFAVSTLGYLPIRGRTALVGRSNLIITRAENDAEIPFYYLPVLDSRLLAAYPPDRFVGRDVLALGGGIRFPIRDFIGVYGIDALVMGYLGNAYTDVFDQVSADVTFGQGALAEDGRVPFRPALGIGLGIVNLDKERVVLGGLVGFSPDGISLATLRIAYDLRDARPLFR
ncbi:hypothetical protein [Rubricoccus marinus]|uniref:Bacterial surface antigen (D15) domain-containing protein n=1 Tax=Rubricoccus marinus TaxID=716817 RepID=A0A259TX52_9BACT|nr:hypothetical protein [Rubricoccus marinus]OZC02352.1 hypothetical protein BSZ36_04790 [Rubricoccus marinus]